MSSYMMFPPNEGSGSEKRTPDFYSFQQSYQPESSGRFGILEALWPVPLDNEPPLLEELGVNFGVIKKKAMVVLNPLRSFDRQIMEDDDLAGPLIFYVLFGLFLLLSGKVQFGYVYGLAIIGCLSFFLLLNCMSSQTIDMFRVCSILGYSMMPLVLLSTLSFVLRLRYHVHRLIFSGTMALAGALFSILWCTASASTLFVGALQIGHMKWLIGYPVFLFYACFALIAVF